MGNCSAVRLVALSVLVALAVGCNKGRPIIDEATAVYLGGDALEAATILERVAVEAPETPEINEARALAVEWLTRKSELEKGERRRTFVAAALKWAPDDPDLNSRRCEVELELKEWEAARTCLQEVDGRIAGREQKRLEDLLAVHDKVLGDAVERKRLLDSGDPNNWYKLRRDFPGTDEAHLAGERLPDASLCADIKRFSQVLFTGGQTGPSTWGARLSEQESQGYQRRVLSEIRNGSTVISEQINAFRTELSQRDLMADEGQVRDLLLEGYGHMQPAMDRLTRLFTGKAYKIADRIKRVQRFAKDFLAVEKKVAEKRLAAEKACEALGR